MMPGTHEVDTVVQGRAIETKLRLPVHLCHLPPFPQLVAGAEVDTEAVTQRSDVSRAKMSQQFAQATIETFPSCSCCSPIGLGHAQAPKTPRRHA